MALLKTYFRVKSPFFHLKVPFFFYKECDELINEHFWIKKVSVTHQITGIWPKKHLQNPEKHSFLQFHIWKNLQSGFETLNVFFWWNLAKTMSSLPFLWANWFSMSIFGVRYPYFGGLCLLFFIWIQTLEKKSFLGEKMGIWT